MAKVNEALTETANSTPPSGRPAHRLIRPLWTGAGVLAVVLAVIGIALPVLPTTPFLLLAAFCFGKGSPRLRHWIETHPRFGPPILAWERSGAIARRHKRLALAMMGATFALGLALALPPYALALQAVCFLGAGTYVWTRPDA